MAEEVEVVKGLTWIIPQGYPYVVLAGVLLCIECNLFGYWTIAARRRIFTKKWLYDNFEEEHMSTMTVSIQTSNEKNDKILKLTSEISTFGFPDAGDGRYSEKLTYQDWFTFNQVARVHTHFTESLPAMISILAFGGIALPIVAAAIGFITLAMKLLGFIIVLNSHNFKLGGCLKMT